jgi:hypothetical protein
MSNLRVNQIQDVTGIGRLNFASSGNLTNNLNTRSHTLISNRTSANRFATWSTSFTSENTGVIDTVATLGYPSGTKVILAMAFWQIDGYGGSAGADHATCAFGPNDQSGQLFTSSGNIPDVASGNFIFAHDGDGVSGWGTYGTWWQGLVTVNANGLIYYRLGNGYSGGTHFIRMNFHDYWI